MSGMFSFVDGKTSREKRGEEEERDRRSQKKRRETWGEMKPVEDTVEQLRPQTQHEHELATFVVLPKKPRMVGLQSLVANSLREADAGVVLLCSDPFVCRVFSAAPFPPATPSSPPRKHTNPNQNRTKWLKMSRALPATNERV